MRKTFVPLLLALVAALTPLAASAGKHPAKKHPPVEQQLPPFSESAEVRDFIQLMHEQYGFDVTHLTRQFAAIHSNASVLRAIKPAAVPELQRSWPRYRERFVNERRIGNGLRFWQENGAELARAEAIYGVPPEIVAAIIGVETEYGRNMGNFSVLEALSTLAFDYPPRAEFFRTELEQFLLLARENRLDPLAIKGSFAGAIGIPQFMPGSQRRYAVDFDGDQRIDLGGSVDDAIGSVAHFLEQHGWQAGQPIAVPAQTSGEPERALLDAGLRPSLKLAELREKGVNGDIDPQASVALIDLVSPERATEYWLGFDNFYVITRYNRSSFYAMSVFQLSEEIRNRLPH